MGTSKDTIDGFKMISVCLTKCIHLCQAKISKEDDKGSVKNTKIYNSVVLKARKSDMKSSYWSCTSYLGVQSGFMGVQPSCLYLRGIYGWILWGVDHLTGRCLVGLRIKLVQKLIFNSNWPIYFGLINNSIIQWRDTCNLKLITSYIF